MLYLFSIIIFLFAAAGFTILITGTSVLNLFDSITLLQMLLMLIPVLIAARMDKDLLCAFRLMIKKSISCSVAQLKRCEQAVSLTMKFTLCSGALSCLILLIAIFRIIDLSGPEWTNVMLSNISVALLSIIYPLFLCCLLLPVRARILGEIINHLDQNPVTEEGGPL